MLEKPYPVVTEFVVIGLFGAAVATLLKLTEVDNGTNKRNRVSAADSVVIR